MNRHKIALLGLLLVAVIWGTGFVASSLALDFFTTHQILALRFTISFVVLLVVNHKQLKRIQRNSILQGAILGFFLYLAFLFQTLGLEKTTASKNAFLTATNIIILPVLASVLSKDTISKKMMISIVLTFIGIGFLSWDEQQFSLNIGDILTLVSALFFALQILATDFFVEKEEAWILLLVQLGVASLLSIIVVLLRADVNFHFSVKGTIPILHLALISTLLAYYIQTISQKYTSAAEAAVILSTEALFGMIGSIIILKEQVSLIMKFGSFLMLIGILLSQLPSKE